jgi:ActR/RegA family two-component response regulator
MGELVVLEGAGRAVEKSADDDRPGVLIVEDSFVTALELSRSLEAAGYRVCGMAGSRAVALRIAERERPRAAIVDLFLADGMTGLAVVRELHERLGTVCLLSTAFPRSACADEPLAWGVVAKPHPPGALGDALAYCLGLAAGTPPAGAPPRGLELLR